MGVRRQFTIPSVLVALAVVTACDAVDRARSRLATPDTTQIGVAGSGLALGMHVPGALRRGDEGMFALSVINRSDSVVSRIRLELIVPAWVEPIPPRPGDREVSMAAMEDGTTRFAYLLDDTPLQPGQTQVVEQRIRVPATALTGDTVPATRQVRGRLLGPDGEPLAEVESELALDGLAADTAGVRAPADTAAARDRLGPVRLGMTAAALRTAAPTARDTTWAQEGMTERGVVFPAAGNGRAVAVLSGDTVSRILVSDPAVRTREGHGVGSTLEALRSAYGTPCADAAEGTVVVWFANAPGISFALDTPVPQDPAQLRASPDRISGSARVTRWWLRRGVDHCPR